MSDGTLCNMIDWLLNSKLLSKCGLISYWIAMFVATHWPEVNRYKPDTGWPIPYFGTVMHVSIYGLWTVMWWWLLRAHGRSLTGAAAAWVIAGAAAYGIFDELTQALVAREPALDDFASNVVGVLVAVTLLQYIDHLIGHRRRQA